MSYILEALRRAEAERQRGSVPNLHTPVVDAPALLPPAPSSFGLGRGPLLGLGALALVVVGWLAAPQLHRLSQSFGGTQATAPGTAPPAAASAGAAAAAGPGTAGGSVPAGAPSTTPSSPPSPRPSATPSAPPAATPGVASATARGGSASGAASGGASPKAAPPPAKPPAGGQSVGAPAKPPSKQAVGRPEGSPPDAAGKPVPRQAVPAKPPSAKPAPAKPAAATPARRLAELPESVRRRIPPLALGGVVYSSVPASRLVVVNGQVLREGESAGKGVKLERVTPLGAIFSFDGHRFEILQ